MSRLEEELSSPDVGGVFLSSLERLARVVPPTRAAKVTATTRATTLTPADPVPATTTTLMATGSGNKFERIENNERMVSIGIDSGAGVGVWPKEVCRDYPARPTEASKNKVTYTGAGSKSAPSMKENVGSSCMLPAKTVG